MKHGISIWSFPAAMSFEEKLRTAKDAGFEGFEIDLSEDGPVRLDGDAASDQRVKAQIEKAGLAVSGLATGLYWGANPASADAETRAKAVKIAKRQVDAAANLGCGAILVVPGTVAADFIPDCEVVPYDACWDRAVAFAKEIGAYAAAKGITVGIENVWNKFLLTPLEMKAFLDAVGLANVQSWFDAGNSLANGYPEQWIRILGRRIARVHFKDYRRAIGTVDGFVELLSGDVNWPEVRKALREIGYEGWVSAEMIPPVPFYKYGGDVLIYNTARAMKRIEGF